MLYQMTKTMHSLNGEHFNTVIYQTFTMDHKGYCLFLFVFLKTLLLALIRNVCILESSSL